MLQYLIAFSLYTLAMTGIFFIAFLVYKKTTSQSGSKAETRMKVEDALRLSQRKTLYVVNVHGERFLIAADFDRTTFLARLDENKKPVLEEAKEPKKKPQRKISALGSLIPESALRRQEEENTKKQIQKYLTELENLDISDEEDDYSNAVDINSRNAIMKNILKELESTAKRTN